MLLQAIVKAIQKSKMGSRTNIELDNDFFYFIYYSKKYGAPIAPILK